MWCVALVNCLVYVILSSCCVMHVEVYNDKADGLMVIALFFISVLTYVHILNKISQLIAFSCTVFK